MKSTLSLVTGLGLAVSCINASVIEKRSSNSWAGANNYFLHALHPQEQADYISSLKSYGTKVVRLWVTGASDGCDKSSNTRYLPQYETTLGQYNQDTTLAAIDNVLSQLQAAGIKAIISPHDANNLPATAGNSGNNGKDVYTSKYQSSDAFYSSAEAKSYYDARLKSILEYKSPSSGLQWKDWSQAILAFDIQNEPMIASTGKLANNDPDDWLCGRAGNMKKVLGSSAVKVATGGIGGSEYCCDHEFNIIDKALYCSAIDIISVHGYMSQASQWSYFIPKLSDQAAAQGKHLMIEEWGVDTSKDQDSVATQAAVFNNAGVPWLYWQIIPGKDNTQSCDGATVPACCHVGMDGFEVGTTSSKANFKTLFGTANSKAGRQDWTGYVY